MLILFLEHWYNVGKTIVIMFLSSCSPTRPVTTSAMSIRASLLVAFTTYGSMRPYICIYIYIYIYTYIHCILGGSSITKLTPFFRIYGDCYLTVSGRQFDSYLTII